MTGRVSSSRGSCRSTPARFDGFDDQILALYAGGMTTREIRRHLRELYGVDVSDGLIAR